MREFVEVDLPHKAACQPEALLVVITFFVPCYNEERHIAGTVDTIHKAATQLNISHEILVFDDCSTDDTVGVVKRLAAAQPHIPIRLLRNHTNQGVARNFIDGAFEGCGTYYRLVCGDDVEPVESLVKSLAFLGKADIIIPYHTHVEGRSFLRNLISNLYTRLVNIASGEHLNYYNGLPIFRRRDVMRFHVEATGSGYQAEFLLRLLHEGRSFIQIPLAAADREGSLSLNVRNFVSVGHSLFKIVAKRIRNALAERQRSHRK